MNNLNLSEKLLSGVERFDDLPRYTKFFAASVGSLCIAIVTEAVPNNPPAVPFVCVAAAAGYLAASYRTFRQDNPTINPED